MKTIVLQKNKTYSRQDVCLVAENKAEVVVGKDVLKNAASNFEAVKKLQKKKVYGLTTGVADLSVENPNVSNDTFQKNILLSHSIGFGENLPKEVVRATIFSRLIVLSAGMSGVSPELLVFLAELLNKDIVPIVPSLGSIGASDLTILAGIFVSLCNKGKVLYQNQALSPFDAFTKANINYPKKLQTREGLALINGNNAAIGLSCLLIKQFEEFLIKSLTCAALSLEGRGGTWAVGNPANQKTRPFKGQKKAADTVKNLVEKSDQVCTSYENEKNTFLQDPPSFKTITQVFGNAFDVLDKARDIVKTELNSIVDNPLFITTSKGIEIVSSGNYVCPQLATIFDQLSLIIASIAQTSVSRIKILLNNEYNEGLPAYLIEDNTNNTGFMITAYTAESVLSEIKALIYPRSSFGIPVANGWEDVSTNACNTCLNTQKILSLAQEIQRIEFALALQAMALRKKKNPTIIFGQQTQDFFTTAQKKLKMLPVKTDADISDFLEGVKRL